MDSFNKYVEYIISKINKINKSFCKEEIISWYNIVKVL